MCHAFVWSVFYLYLGAGGSDPECGTIVMHSREQSICLCMSEILIAGKSPWIPPLARTRFSLPRHGDIDVVSVPLQPLTLAIAMYRA